MKTIFGFWSLFLTCFLFIIPHAQASDPSNIPISSTLLLPPTHLHGHQIANQFVSQTDLINVIKWSPPKGGITPVAYNIYRNVHLTDLLAVIPANHKLTFSDHNRKEHHKYSYFIVSVDSAGNQSNPIGIIFEGPKTHVVKVKKLVAIEVTPINPSVAEDIEIQFTATGIFSDNSKKDLTTQVAWSSSNTAIATISNEPPTQGLATSLSPGTTQIAATFRGVSGSTTLNVTAATLVSIEVIPTNPKVAAGFEEQFTAIGTFSDNTIEDLTTQVFWSSSNTTTATISNTMGSQGLATGVSQGTATITATLGTTSGSTTLTVTKATLQSITVTPALPTIAAGFTERFTATGLFSDNTTENLTHEVVWSSSNRAVARISNLPGSQGLATGISSGTAQITATHGLVKGSTTLTVTAAVLVSIEIGPENPTVAAGHLIQFSANGIFSDGTSEDLTKQVTWHSSNQSVARISNSTIDPGLAITLRVGTTTISASFNGVSTSTTLTVTSAVLVFIEVTPNHPKVPVKFSEQFTATGIFSDGSTEDLTKEVAWGSSNAVVARISNGIDKGLAITLAVGTSKISATLNGKTGSTILTVTPATLESIEIYPLNATRAAGFTVQYIAIGIFNDKLLKDLTNDPLLTWESSDENVAVISNTAGDKGTATGISSGEVTIIASADDVISDSATLTITDAVLKSIQVTPINPQIAAETTIQFTAMGLFSDGTLSDLTKSVLWKSSGETVALISDFSGSKGKALGITPGTSQITAQFKGITSDPSLLTVTTATVVSIAVTPNPAQTPLGITQQFKAVGTFTDGRTQNITDVAMWSSSDTTIAAISNASDSQGLATPIAVGSTTISAFFRGTTGSAPLTVTAATLVSIDVTPTTVSIPAGFITQFTAIGTYSDSSTQDLTQQVVWSSDNTDVATISNLPGTNGLATGRSSGIANITAAFGAVTSNIAQLTVTNAILQSIAITPANATLAYNTTNNNTQFTATGTFSDSSTKDITTEVIWSSSNTTTAGVSNAIGSQGVVTVKFNGSTTISATLSGIVGNTGLTVTCSTFSISPNMPAAIRGQRIPPYSGQIMAPGVILPATYGTTGGAGTLPPGLSLNMSTGLVTGVVPFDPQHPMGSVPYTFIVEVTSICGTSMTGPVTINTIPPGP